MRVDFVFFKKVNPEIFILHVVIDKNEKKLFFFLNEDEFSKTISMHNLNPKNFIY